MKKVKKYIYPVIFSICFFVTYIILAIVLEVALPSGDYAGLGYIFIVLLIWIFIVMPIYCFRYCKLIRQEKHKFLFGFYNALVVVICHIAPFMREPGTSTFNVVIKIAVFLFVWALLWSILFFKSRANSCEEPEQTSEKKVETSFLLQSKTKNIIAICFTSLYMISLITDSATWQLDSLYTLPLFSAGLFLLFILLRNENHIFKKFLLPAALAGNLISGLFSICSSLENMDIQLKYIPLYPITFAFSCLMFILSAIMFAGVIFNFKYTKLLKYGSLGYVVALLIFNMINVGRIAYQQINLNGTLALNTSVVIMRPLIRVLYFTGIFILTTNKRNLT